MNDIAICTISAKNFSAHARTLLNSVRQFHNDVDLFYLVADENVSKIQQSNASFEVIQASDIEISTFYEMAFKYDIIEFSVALKPFIIKKLLVQGYKKVIYFDADIMVFHSLNSIIQLLNHCSIIITPHILSPIPLESEFHNWERRLLQNGSYNLGFIALSNTAESGKFLQWWSDKCVRECYREQETGLCVDQKWVDLVPSLFNYVYILKDVGCNMAYWNLHERKLQSSMLVNGREPLIFFHFSGLDLENINQISKYQNTYSLEKRPDLNDIFQVYKKNVLLNGYDKVRNLVYAYGQYDNGVPIGLVARRLYSAVAQQYPDPFETKKGGYYELLKKNKLLESNNPKPITIKQIDSKSKVINYLLRNLCKIIGIDRYNNLMRYMRYVSVIRRQTFLLNAKWTFPEIVDTEEPRS